MSLVSYIDIHPMVIIMIKNMIMITVTVIIELLIFQFITNLR